MKIRETAEAVFGTEFLVAEAWAEADTSEDCFQILGRMKFNFDLCLLFVSRGQTVFDAGRYWRFVGQNAASVRVTARRACGFALGRRLAPIGRWGFDSNSQEAAGFAQFGGGRIVKNVAFEDTRSRLGPELPQFGAQLVYVRDVKLDFDLSAAGRHFRRASIPAGTRAAAPNLSHPRIPTRVNEFHPCIGAAG